MLAQARHFVGYAAALAGNTGAVAVGPDMYQVGVPNAAPLNVRLSSGPLPGAEVAQSTRNPDGSYTLTLSDRAADGVVGRALAHEFAELTALSTSGGQQSLQTNVGPVDPDPNIPPTPHDRGRFAEVRLLANDYRFADQAGKLHIRAELDALADHLGMRVSFDPDVQARLAKLPADVRSSLQSLSTPRLTSADVESVLKSTQKSGAEAARLRDHFSTLTDGNGDPLGDAEVAAKMRELAVGTEGGQGSLPTLPAYAGQIIGLPQSLLNQIAQIDQALATKVANEGVYVGLDGRIDLESFAHPSVPSVVVGDHQTVNAGQAKVLHGGRHAFDLGTDQGRAELLGEDRMRAEGVLRAMHGDAAANGLLAFHSFHYDGAKRSLSLVPTALTDALLRMAPAPQVGPVETAPLSTTPAETHVRADRVSRATPTHGSLPEYGTPTAGNNQPIPVFDGVPTREQVAQGALGDCAILASMAAVVASRPEIVTRLIQPNPDGTVDVVFKETARNTANLWDPAGAFTATGREIRVTVTPDVPINQNALKRKEAAYASQVGVNSQWASIVEKGIAALDRAWSDQRRADAQRLYNYRVDNTGKTEYVAMPAGYERIGLGNGNLLQAEVMAQLTGYNASWGSFDTSPGAEVALEAELRQRLADGNPLIVASRPDSGYPGGTPPFKLVGNHAYEIVGLENGMVQLRNPWNMRHPEKMSVRDLLDSTTGQFARLDAAPVNQQPGGFITAAEIPGSDFHGRGREAPAPEQVMAVAGRTVPLMGGITGVDSIVEVAPGRYEAHLPNATSIRFDVQSVSLPGTEVARTTMSPDGSYTISVSDRARNNVVPRALAHEIAELAAIHRDPIGAALAPLQTGGPDGPIDTDPKAGATPHDQGRFAEVRVLARQYAAASDTGKAWIRAEMTALAEHLGLHDPQGDRARWAKVPPEVAADIRRIAPLELTSAYVEKVLAARVPGPAESERISDYLSHLRDANADTLDDAALRQKLTELATEGEHSQTSMPRLPEHAGRIIGLPEKLLDRIARLDPQLAAQVRADGVYVRLDGRVALESFAPRTIAPIVLDGDRVLRPDPANPRVLRAELVGGNHVSFDLSTADGRRSLAAEDAQRSVTALRVMRGDADANALLATHSFQYDGVSRRMSLVPKILVESLARMSPAPAPAARNEVAPVSETPTRTTVQADRVTMADSGTGRAAPTYAQPNSNGVPFPLTDGTPSREQVAQGGLGDCALLASLAAVVGHDPDLVNRLVQPNPDGTVDVVFHETSRSTGVQWGRAGAYSPTGKELRITVTPDVPSFPVIGEAAYARQFGAGRTSWASLVEKAIASLDRTWSDARHAEAQRTYNHLLQADGKRTHVAAPLGYARLNLGNGSELQAELMSQLTGRTASWGEFDVRPGAEVALEQELSGLLAAGNAVVVASLPQYTPVSYDPVTNEPIYPYKIVANHAYEVISVRNGMVQLRNPWNQSHPDPMPVRNLLDGMRPGYARLEAAATSADTASPAGAAPSSGLLAEAGRWVSYTAWVAGAPAIDPLGPGRYRVTLPDANTFELRLDTGPLPGTALARTTGSVDGSFSMTFSEGLSQDALPRVFAHELAELVALHELPAGPRGGLPEGPIDADPGTPLSPFDRGRLAELRVLADQYRMPGADPLRIRSEVDALTERLGLRRLEPGRNDRWRKLPPALVPALLDVMTPPIDRGYVESVLNQQPGTPADEARRADFDKRLKHFDGDLLNADETSQLMRRLLVEAEHSPTGLPLLPSYAGTVLRLPPHELDLIRRSDPALAAKAGQGVYVGLDGRVNLTDLKLDIPHSPSIVLDGELRPKTAPDGSPSFELTGGNRSAYDLTTPEGRASQLHEDRLRTEVALRVERGTTTAEALLATNSLEYEPHPTQRRMMLVPKALTEALGRMATPPPALTTPVEATATSVTPNRTSVLADKVTMTQRHGAAPLKYGQPLDGTAPFPLFSGDPSRNQVAQGQLGDCGMLATLGAVASTRPDLIKNMLHPNPDGTIDVLLHESERATGTYGDTAGTYRATGRELRVTVTPDVPLDSLGIADYANVNDIKTSWVSVVEKAIAALDRTWTIERQVELQRYFNREVDPTGNTTYVAAPMGFGRLDVGSTNDMQAELLTQLTGVGASWSQFNDDPGAEVHVEQYLTDLLARNYPVIVATKSADRYGHGPVPFDLKPSHAYELVSVQNGLVQLHNPHNLDHPQRMTVREMLDSLRPGYMTLDPRVAPRSTRITAAAIPGSEFHGHGRPGPDPAAVVREARRVFPLLQTATDIPVHRLGPDLYSVQVPGGQSVRMRVTAGSLTGAEVAQTVRSSDGEYLVTLSHQAADGVISRALAHEIAELAAVLEGGPDAPLDGAPDRPIDPAPGVPPTPHERGRFAEIRVLDAQFRAPGRTISDRMRLQDEMVALTEHLGLNGADPDAQARRDKLPAEVLAAVERLVVPKLPQLTSADVNERLSVPGVGANLDKMRADYRSVLGGMNDAQITTKLRELALTAENGPLSLALLPEHAGTIVHLTATTIDQIASVDHKLAEKLRYEGVYVGLDGRVDLEAYSSVIPIELGDHRSPEKQSEPLKRATRGVPAYDLSSAEGRATLLDEDRLRAEGVLRARHGIDADALLKGHRWHYDSSGQRLLLVPKTLLEALTFLAPVPTVNGLETTATRDDDGTSVRVRADRVTLAHPLKGKGPATYGRPRDINRDPVPLFDGPPTRDQVVQGDLGDCALMAVLGAVAARRPEIIERLVRSTNGNSFEVVFAETRTTGADLYDSSGSFAPTGTQLRITVSSALPLGESSPPIKQSAYARQAEMKSSWASVVEKAIAALDRSWSVERRVAGQRYYNYQIDGSGKTRNIALPVGYERLGMGNRAVFQAELFSQLTGEPAAWGIFDDSRPDAEAEVRRALTELLADGSAVTVATVPPASLRGPDVPAELAGNHVYEIVSVRDDGMVELRNPRGRPRVRPITILELLAYTTHEYAHLGAHSTLPPSLRQNEWRQRLGPQSPVDAVGGSDGATAAGGMRHSPGRIITEKEHYSFIYFAVLSIRGEPEGLRVVEATVEGPRIGRWMARDASGLGGERAVSRAEAERITSEVLGFTLPSERELHGMLGS